jgi:hypothetical protein
MKLFPAGSLRTTEKEASSQAQDSSLANKRYDAFVQFGVNFPKLNFSYGFLNENDDFSAFCSSFFLKDLKIICCYPQESFNLQKTHERDKTKEKDRQNEPEIWKK